MTIESLTPEQFVELSRICAEYLDQKRDCLTGPPADEHDHVQRLYTMRASYIVFIVGALLREGHRVYVTVKQREKGLSSGEDVWSWPSIHVDDKPMWHICPDDLPTEDLERAGILHRIFKDTPEEKQCEWAGTSQVDETLWLHELMRNIVAPPSARATVAEEEISSD